MRGKILLFLRKPHDKKRFFAATYLTTATLAIKVIYG